MMIGQKFPDITTSACLPDGTLTDTFNVLEHSKGKYSVVFFYPLDFTFVCPTELVAFDNLVDEFASRNCTVISASTDSAHCHAAWRRTALNDGGIGEVKYPMLADNTHELSKELGILTDNCVTYRATYILDKDGVIRHMLINDLPLGRNVEETLRMLDALQFTEEHGEVCPANWKKGQTGMKANRESTAAYLSAVPKAA